jgi:hypothetical protein
MTDRALGELHADRLEAGSTPRARPSPALQKLRRALYEGVRFTALLVVGVLGVWALVLLFG